MITDGLNPTSDYTEQTLEFSKALGPDEQILTSEELKKILNIETDNTIRRYSNIRTIGLGGIGSVLSAYESVLNREVAIKVLRPAYRNKKKFLNRFIREARATAQIEHPNIVPVHHLGVFDDIGVYFMMKKVDGETLRSVLDKLNQGNEEYLKKYSLRRLLEIFISACNGVAFAHSKGIIHRDLKPSNIMLGDFGEVMVMDWGLVKYRAEHDVSDGGQKVNLDANIGIAGSERDSTVTIDGSISGTPAYMAPEQAGGRISDIDEQTDLYSLGAILYSILTWKPSPFEDNMTTNQVLSHVVNNYFVAPRRRTPKRDIPKELESICLKAMSGNKTDRYLSVKELIHDTRNYLENFPVSAYPLPPWLRFFKMCRRHPLIPSAAIVAIITFIGVMTTIYIENSFRTNSLLKLADYSIEQGDVFYQRAKATYQNIQKSYAQMDDDPNDKELQLDDELTRQIAEFNNHYEAAIEFLSRMEGLGLKKQQITDKMVDVFRKRLEFSILTDNNEETKRLINNLRMRRRDAFYEIIGKDKILFGQTRMIVQGEANISINTKPEAADIFYQQLQANASLAVNDSEKKYLGKSPFTGKIHEGSYLFSFKVPGCPEVIYPAMIHCAKDEKLDVFIPASIPPNMVYIPAGNFYVGTDVAKRQLRRQYLPGYFISKYEVTFREYLRFWKTLKTDESRNRYMAKYVFGSNGRKYVDIWQHDGKLVSPFKLDMPVVGITGEAAEAYCRWVGTVKGLSCRLPTVMEWEKAARGVDGRSYVWGNTYYNDASLNINNRQGKEKYPVSAPPGSFPKDVSVYGVFDLCGNVREFAQDGNSEDAVLEIKGGSVNTGKLFAHCSFTSYASGSENDIGFRFVVPLNEKTASAKVTPSVTE